MKKIYTLLFIFFFTISFANAQWVTIPDSGFTAWLNQHYPLCMNGNQMDTNCVASPQSLLVITSNQGIVDLEGIQYFKSVNELWITGNPITNLPKFANNTQIIEITNTLLTTLPDLPPNLLNLTCNNNLLTTLPTLPSSLKYLTCNNNQLVSLPTFPSSLNEARAWNNQLASIPELPDTLDYLMIHNNPNLNCLPYLKRIVNFYFYNTNIQCRPNVGNIVAGYPSVNTLPICDLFNSNNCDVYWNISGNVFSDLNNNCSNESNSFLKNLKLKLFKNNILEQQVLSDDEGHYSFNTDLGVYTFTVDTTNIPLFLTCPPSGLHSSNLTPLDSFDINKNFGMQCKPGFDVGVKNIIRTSGRFFPATYATVKSGAGDMANFYGLTCASGIGGSVIVDFTGPITFISEAPGALIPSVAGNTLTYTISDFGLVNLNSDIRFIVQTDTTAQAGTPVCFTVNVTPTSGDNDVSNNTLEHCFSVANSLDPNAKEVFPQGGITPNQEWMTYTIHFQNTGNAPAQNIYVLDTLDQNLIPSSFTLLSFSHEPLTQIFGSVVKFNFPNINLPDSTNDEPNSHGFVQYKVRMVQGLPVGTVISNTAYNYFDFNAPVATNTVSNIIGLTSITNNFEKIDFSIFPNPTKDELNISFNLNSLSEIKIEIYNSLGQVVKSVSKAKHEAGRNLINFSIADLTKGIYNLKFSAGEDVSVKRIVKL